MATWEDLANCFLRRFFPPGRTSYLRDKILRFEQGKDETTKEAWTHFLDCQKRVQHHGIEKWLLVHIFYYNLIPTERVNFNKFTGFKFHLLTPEEGWNQFENYARSQDEEWYELTDRQNVHSILSKSQPTQRDRLKLIHKQLSYLTKPEGQIGLENPTSAATSAWEGTKLTNAPN